MCEEHALALIGTKNIINGPEDPKSEDIPCLGDITMIMDSLREFVIDTDPLRDLFSQPVA